MKNILVIGAGACGLMAARELGKKGFKVIILEARDRVGGRIHTIKDEKFPQEVELGAEFIHGELPLTLKLLEEYKIEKHVAGGEFFYSKNGEYVPNDDAVLDYHGELEKCLEKLEADISVEDFLESNFPEPRYRILRESVRGFVEGFDTGEISHCSALAFKEEWLGMEEHQYRIEGGYIKLIEALENDCIQQGSEIILNTIVKAINWSENNVEVITGENKTYTAEKIIVTVPLGILTADKNDKAYIEFNPELPEIKTAAEGLGYGSLIKIIFSFEETFWEKESIKQWLGIDTSKMGFILSQAPIPTWWTQVPRKIPVLTGWLGGPNALAYTKYSDAELYELAMSSLEIIFGEKAPVPLAHHIIHWNNDPFSKGSYSYETVNAKQFIATLKTPIRNTIFFAGEALYEGEGMATVEAALQSGKQLADLVITFVR